MIKLTNKVTGEVVFTKSIVLSGWLGHILPEMYIHPMQELSDLHEEFIVWKKQIKDPCRYYLTLLLVKDGVTPYILCDPYHEGTMTWMPLDGYDIEFIIDSNE